MPKVSFRKRTCFTKEHWKNNWKPSKEDFKVNYQWVDALRKEYADSLGHKTEYIKKYAGKTLAYFPLIFLAWDYYNSGSMVHSVITCVRDFMWPMAVVAAKSLNASPYQMLATNVAGIGWTIYNCFFADHEEM